MTVGFEIELFSALSCYSLKGETCVGTLINRTTPSCQPHDKDQAVRTIIYQSDMRTTDLVGGCYRYG
ncbi:hypothetical protein ACSQ67_021628 [Phaseolus vulgaris]